MVARCDGEFLNELVFYELPKQEIIPGPLQIEALINQDQVISKDLSLWNQQGSQVLRSQILTLPIDNTFLFVAPIYIQASEARMPQLKKVALAVGNTLAYADTYPQALAELAQKLKAAPPATSTQTSATPAPSTPAQAAARPIVRCPHNRNPQPPGPLSRVILPRPLGRSRQRIGIHRGAREKMIRSALIRVHPRASAARNRALPLRTHPDKVVPNDHQAHRSSVRTDHAFSSATSATQRGRSPYGPHPLVR